MSDEYLVEARGLSLRYGAKTAVDNIAFNIPKGRVVGLLGHNGAGKTSLMKALVGLMPASQGELRVLGLDPLRQREQLLAGLSYIPDVAVLPRWARVDELIRLMSGLQPSFSAERARALLKRTSVQAAVNVLIVDDQLSARTMLRHIIEGISPDIRIADFGDPEAAMSWSEESDPDLLLLDYRMPKLDGLEFARRFRRNAAHRDVPIVLITVVGDEPVRQAALDAGVIDFMGLNDQGLGVLGIDVEPDLAGVALEGVDFEVLLLGEQPVVELPELAPLGRHRRRQVGGRGVLVHRQRQVLPDDAHVVAIDLFDPLEGRTDPRAERSLKVRKLGDGHRRVRRPFRWRAGGLDLVDLVRIRPAPARGRLGRHLVDLVVQESDPAVDLVQPVVEAGVDAADLAQARVGHRQKRPDSDQGGYRHPRHPRRRRCRRRRRVSSRLARHSSLLLRMSHDALLGPGC